MTEYIYSRSRMATIYRLAPWVDIAELRLEVLKVAQTFDAISERVSDYENGERATLPLTWQINDAVEHAVLELYRSHSDDPRYWDAIEKFRIYFQDGTFWEKVE